MIQAKNSMYDTKGYRVTNRWPILLVFLLGIGVRLGQLTWQPLWADEGYSLYFATEPLSRMLWLTANDIHPPFYYALLHLWATWFTHPEPAVVRIFSVVVSLPALFLFALLTNMLFPHRPRVLFLATLLFAVNPLHIFYSQEVRMYGLAMTLTLAASITFWQAIKGTVPRRQYQSHGYRAHGYWWLAYIVLATVALYTLYYSAFLLLAHCLWALWLKRRQWRELRAVAISYLLIVLLYIPWVIYTASTLALYIDDKIGADQDEPLGLLTYLARHLLAFLSGHLTWPTWPIYWRWGAVVVLILLVIPLLWHRSLDHIFRIASEHSTGLSQSSKSGTRLQDKGLMDATQHRTQQSTEHSAGAEAALWIFLLVPTAIAFLINRLFPFFPEGGERLLLFVLPYALLLIALGIDKTWQWWHWGKGILLLLLLSAGGGIVTFYTLPRHHADDYRPLIRQVIQQGSDEDTLLATFPWQVGLWRAYAPSAYPSPITASRWAIHGPEVILLSERSVVWGEPLRIAIQEALAKGTLWYPGLRSIGSTLPEEIDRYFTQQPSTQQPSTQQPVLLVDSWHGNTTLRAWRQMPAPDLKAHPVDFGPLQLVSAAVEPTAVASANAPLRIDLEWATPIETNSLLEVHGMTIRLVGDGRQWANRDLEAVTAVTGLIVPAGLPPGIYEVLLGVVDAGGQLLASVSSPNKTSLISLGALTVTTPDEPLPAARLPIQTKLAAPVEIDGLVLLGYSANNEIPLAGETMAVTLFWQNGEETLPLRNLYVSLLDTAGHGVAGWEGWPLTNYPTTELAPGALLQTPLEFALPPSLATALYQLGAGLLDPTDGRKSPIVIFGEQAIQQRTINYTALHPPLPLSPPIQFGSHARLTGYAVVVDETTATIQLFWQVLQPLLPPHHIFIHLVDDMGQTVAQSDDEPHTVAGRAPTGSWLPDEYLVTEHQIVADVLRSVDTMALDLNIGLYVPATGVRLPTVTDGAITGDHVTLPIQP